MLKVNPATGEPYRTDIDYYCIYKHGDEYFYVKENVNRPFVKYYDGQWSEFIGAYEEEWNAIQMLNILKGVESRKSRMKQLFKWNTNLKRDLDNYRKRVEENNKK